MSNHDQDLTVREISVLQHAADGLTSEDTAGDLGITRGTVQAFRKNIMWKLGADNITHAVSMGIRRKIIE